MKPPVFLAALLLLTACAGGYTLVPPAPVSVAAGALTVAPAAAWNRAPRTPLDVKWEENWTRNGPLLDAIGFVAALPDGQAIVRQRRKTDRQVPVFRADMSPQDLVSMLETYYRIKAGAMTFETVGVQPATFVGAPGLRFDYRYLGADEVRRQGRAYIAIADARLYLMTLDGTALHYFDAAAPQFDTLAASAKRR